ncbi:hypothetical protein [Geofilum rhodophaeum]|uniref:hypothetical protein n=1 Tax=Geofilum rhodophaeum TaxID=1965019 RepID=UPI000B522496|nr:hypothetical protein [Geofilum rhodophaeum]
MLRNLSILLLLSLWACGDPAPQAPLYGTIWGGEGSRLVLRSVPGDKEIHDTLLIDHQGNFLWQPDTLVPGFYTLEKQSGKQLTLLFIDEQPIRLDAQYPTFPENCQTTGSPFCRELKIIDDLSTNWQQALLTTSRTLRDSAWEATTSNIYSLQLQLDSVTAHFRQQALEAADHPLVRLYALLQQSGQRPLFHPWEQRQHYFAVDSQLSHYRYINEVALFHQNTRELLQREQKAQRLEAGQNLPEFLLDIDQGDSLLTSSLQGQATLLLFFDRQDPRSVPPYKESHEMLQAFRWSPLQIHLFHTDSLPYNGLSDLRPLAHIHYHQLQTQRRRQLLQEGLLLQQPANLLLTEDGRIAARNLWGTELQQGLEQLLQK